MEFELKKYNAPDLERNIFVSAPDAKLTAAKNDGVVPDDFHAMSIFPEYFKIDGQWVMAEESRMDCVAVYSDGKIRVVEPRRVKSGDLVVCGRTENAQEGIYLHTSGFEEKKAVSENFAFRQNRSRETSFSKDYDELVELLKYEKECGKIVWVSGPAFAFDQSSRAALSRLIDNGYVHALLAGNALATHDLEGAYYGTALGQDIYTQESVPNGHYNHLALINKARQYGSIDEFIEKENIDNGIIYSCYKNKVPYILCGSIRDDGPLPGVYSDVYEGQNAMRGVLKDATTVICMATMLHSIAVGNMTPSYRVTADGTVRQVYFYCIDNSEFVVNKLSDRGSLAAKGIITNVQDFIINLGNRLK